MSVVMLQGFTLGASLIMPIGAQNAYVLRQGLRRERHLWVAGLCLLCDCLLISLGVFGGGRFLASLPWLKLALTLGGSLFLLVYGGQSLWRAWRNGSARLDLLGEGAGDKAILFTTLGVTLLNPHVYLDTVMILGSMAAQWPHQALPAFALGAVLASTVWFFGLALLAARLAPWLSHPQVPRGIDALVGLIMLGLGSRLLLSLFG